MRERAEKLKTEAQDCLIATFHSMCVRILRREADHIGYNRNFTIVDPGEQRTLMKRILKISIWTLKGGMSAPFWGLFPMLRMT